MTDTPKSASGASQPKDQQTSRIEKDAKGQFVGTHHGSENDGVASAKPTVITGSDDATTHKWSPDEKNRPDDWDANFDLGDSDNSRE